MSSVKRLITGVRDEWTDQLFGCFVVVAAVVFVIVIVVLGGRGSERMRESASD